MLLDNHYGPDPRVAFEAELLEHAGIDTCVIAWDRRSQPAPQDGETTSPEVVRIGIPAPSGGGWRSMVAVARFGAQVWRRRSRLREEASLIVVHDVYLLPLGWLLARRLGVDFIYDAHEEYARMEADRYPSWVLRLVTALENRFAKGAVAVAVPGASRVARWQGILEEPPIVLPNLVRRNRPTSAPELVDWDLIHAGTISAGRRLDILVELARLRPDLRIGIAGRGRSVDYVAEAAEQLPNLTYLGWRSDVDQLLACSKAIYYGLDPGHPYSAVACPNTLYQTLLHRKPLIFFCGGEPAALAEEFKIGIRCEASAGAVSAAVDRVSTRRDWEFDDAWTAVWERAETHRFIDAVKAALGKPVDS